MIPASFEQTGPLDAFNAAITLRKDPSQASFRIRLTAVSFGIPFWLAGGPLGFGIDQLRNQVQPVTLFHPLQPWPDFAVQASPFVLLRRGTRLCHTRGPSTTLAPSLGRHPETLDLKIDECGVEVRCDLGQCAVLRQWCCKPQDFVQNVGFDFRGLQNIISAVWSPLRYLVLSSGSWSCLLSTGVFVQKCLHRSNMFQNIIGTQSSRKTIKM